MGTAVGSTVQTAIGTTNGTAVEATGSGSAVRRRAGAGLWRAFRRDVEAAGVTLAPPISPAASDLVTDAEVDGFDEPVRRYLRFMGVVGRPRVRAFTAEFAGRFRLRPGMPWMRASAVQRDTVDPISRVFTMRLSLARVLRMLGHDVYVGGRGRMQGKLFGLVTVADGSGEEFDIGELSTWLNDAVLLAPSMLLRDTVSWRATGADAFEVSLTDHGRTVRAEVRIDGRGAPVDYRTTDRWAALPSGPVRAPWRTPVPRWDVVDGRPFPGPTDAIWELDDGPFAYVRGGFVPGTLRIE